METAMRLAMEGDLLQRHGQNGESKKNLIVVSLFAHNGGDQAVADQVDQLLREYHVENVQEDNILQFVSKVEREAHSA